MRKRRSTSFIAAAAALCWVTGAAAASAQGQALGVGPRFSFVRGDVTAETATRYAGAFLRMRASDRTSIEIALDYRSVINDDLTERIKDYPIQGSVLLYPVRATVSPYVLGGIGWYSQRVDALASDAVLTSKTTRKVGYHAGIGGEIRVGGRAAVHADYRYTFINFGSDQSAAPGAVPIPGLGDLQKRLKLSHQGSMWTTGVSVYF